MGTEYDNVSSTSVPRGPGGRESVLDVLKELFGDLRNSQPSPTDKDKSFLTRHRAIVGRKIPRLNRSLRYVSNDLLTWMHSGGTWRPLLILTTGLITLISLSGIFAFLLFLLIATVNAVVVALLGSVAAVGAVTAFFFVALTSVYIGAIVVASLVISTIAFFAVCAVATAAGWIGFWWLIWLGVKKTLNLAQSSLAFTASTIQSFGGHSQVQARDLNSQFTTNSKITGIGCYSKGMMEIYP